MPSALGGLPARTQQAGGQAGGLHSDCPEHVPFAEDVEEVLFSKEKQFH